MINKISVCLASYNGHEYIKRQLSSILSQIGPNDEVIVSDDGSTDGTLDVVRGMLDDRIKIIDGPHKGSPTANFENALKYASGNVIFLADQDDVWVDGKVAVCMDYLKRYDCVVSDAIVTDGDLNVICDSFFFLNKTKPGKAYNMFVKNGYLGCCMAFRRSVLDKALPFPAKTPMHDIWIGNVAAVYFKLVFIADKLIYFRRHKHNSSSTARKSDYGIYDKLLFRLHICLGLMNARMWISTIKK